MGLKKRFVEDATNISLIDCTERGYIDYEFHTDSNDVRKTFGVVLEVELEKEDYNRDFLTRKNLSRTQSDIVDNEFKKLGMSDKNRYSDESSIR